MLSDRGYMRSDYQRESTSMLTWILSAVIAAGIVQLACERLLKINLLAEWFAFSRFNLFSGKIWTLASYAFLHAGIWHLLLNTLGLFLIGRELAPLLGGRRFLGLFLSAAVGGALFWLAVHFAGGGGPLLGASAAVAAIFIVFACIYPEREITFLIFFVLPVTLKPKILAWILVGVDTLGLLFAELPGGAWDTGIAHSAHVGGMIAGWIFYRYFHANNGLDRASAPLFRVPAWLRKSTSTTSAPSRLAASGPASERQLRAEVDRILDKINSSGFGALTDQEKKILDDAKDMLSRR